MISPAVTSGLLSSEWQSRMLNCDDMPALSPLLSVVLARISSTSSSEQELGVHMPILTPPNKTWTKEKEVPKAIST